MPHQDAVLGGRIGVGVRDVDGSRKSGEEVAAGVVFRTGTCAVRVRVVVRVVDGGVEVDGLERLEDLVVLVLGLLGRGLEEVEEAGLGARDEGLVRGGAAADAVVGLDAGQGDGGREAGVGLLGLQVGDLHVDGGGPLGFRDDVLDLAEETLAVVVVVGDVERARALRIDVVGGGDQRVPDGAHMRGDAGAQDVVEELDLGAGLGGVLFTLVPEFRVRQMVDDEDIHGRLWRIGIGDDIDPVRDQRAGEVLQGQSLRFECLELQVLACRLSLSCRGIEKVSFLCSFN